MQKIGANKVADIRIKVLVLSLEEPVPYSTGFRLSLPLKRVYRFRLRINHFTGSGSRAGFPTMQWYLNTQKFSRDPLSDICISIIMHEIVNAVIQ